MYCEIVLGVFGGNDMLKRFEISNYRTFEKTVVIDFADVGAYQFNQDCITDNIISKMIIYGRNATGKTNLGTAIMDIIDIALPMGVGVSSTGNFLNADSNERYAEFKYFFQFGKDEVIYSYKKFSNQQLLDEQLIVNNVEIFYNNFERSIGEFSQLGIVDADTAVLERYAKWLDDYESEGAEQIVTLPFLRWLINNTVLREDSLLLKLDDYIKRMRMIQVGARAPLHFPRFYELLEKDNNLQDFEDFLNIMGVECHLTFKALPDGQKELYFVHNKPVPFLQTASSGTRALMDLYRRLSFGKEASLMYIDEFDAFYHYEMSENVLKFFKAKYPKCQLILTTHNTNLMTNKLMRPDSVFILSRDGRLTALCNATTRELREGHNLEKLYISGEFDKFE